MRGLYYSLVEEVPVVDAMAAMKDAERMTR